MTVVMVNKRFADPIPLKNSEVSGLIMMEYIRALKMDNLQGIYMQREGRIYPRYQPNVSIPAGNALTEFTGS